MLGYADYVVLASTLIISSIIGIYYRHQNNAKDYLLAGGSMSPLPVAFSLMASFMSAITLLGVTFENYTFGTQFMIINLSYAIGTPIAAHIYLPIFFRLESPSAYSYLENRFGLATRLAASMAFSCQMILYMGIVVYAPALALSAVTGLSQLGSILAVGLVCTFYSTLGGIKAVLITDVFQSLLMFASIGSVIIGGAIHLNGDLGTVLEQSEDRLQFFDMNPDPTVRHTFWTQLIGGTFIFLSIYAVNQAQVQRLLSTKNLKSAQMSLWIQWPILMTLSLSTCYAGLTMYAYYKGCDPLKLKRIEKGDQLLPLFVMDTMGNYPGLSGLFISGIFSGSLSTVSSAINSLAAVTMEDFIKPFFTIKVEYETLLLKILAMMFGLSCIILTFIVEYLGPGVLQASLTIFGVVGGPLLGLFTLGMMTMRANQKGALFGFILSLAFLFWIGFGQPKPSIQPLPVSINGTDCMFQIPNNITNIIDDDKMMIVSEDEKSNPVAENTFWLYSISYAWYAFIGTVMTFSIGFVTSLFFKEEPKMDKDLYCFTIRKFITSQDESLENSSDNQELKSIQEKTYHLNNAA